MQPHKGLATRCDQDPKRPDKKTPCKQAFLCPSSLNEQKKPGRLARVVKKKKKTMMAACVHTRSLLAASKELSERACQKENRRDERTKENVLSMKS